MNYSMVKYKVDLSDTAYFNGITIDSSYLSEGLEYAKQHGINRVLIRNEEGIKQKIDFELFKKYDFITTLHWIAPLSKLSNIEGIYSLTKLKELRWAPTINLPIDLSAFPHIEMLSTTYCKQMSGWDELNNLKFLFLTKVDTCNLYFLHKVINLEYLRILRGKIVSISGIDNCSKLKTLFLQSCNCISTLEPTIRKLSLDKLNIENCTNLKADETLNKYVKSISII